MSRSKQYQALLNSKRWTEVKRFVWKRAGGLCEICRQQGFYVPGKDCHHITPVESASNIDDMRRLAYDVNNIQLLCVPCHIRVHQSMRSHQADKVGENKARDRERRAAWLNPNYQSPTDDQRE